MYDLDDDFGPANEEESDVVSYHSLMFGRRFTFRLLRVSEKMSGLKEYYCVACRDVDENYICRVYVKEGAFVALDPDFSDNGHLCVQAEKGRESSSVESASSPCGPKLRERYRVATRTSRSNNKRRKPPETDESESNADPTWTDESNTTDSSDDETIPKKLLDGESSSYAESDDSSTTSESDEDAPCSSANVRKRRRNIDTDSPSYTESEDSSTPSENDEWNSCSSEAVKKRRGNSERSGSESYDLRHQMEVHKRNKTSIAWRCRLFYKHRCQGRGVSAVGSKKITLTREHFIPGSGKRHAASKEDRKKRRRKHATDRGEAPKAASVKTPSKPINFVAEVLLEASGFLDRLQLETLQHVNRRHRNLVETNVNVLPLRLVESAHFECINGKEYAHVKVQTSDQRRKSASRSSMLEDRKEDVIGWFLHRLRNSFVQKLEFETVRPVKAFLRKMEKHAPEVRVKRLEYVGTETAAGLDISALFSNFGYVDIVDMRESKALYGLVDDSVVLSCLQKGFSSLFLPFSVKDEGSLCAVTEDAIVEYCYGAAATDEKTFRAMKVLSPMITPSLIRKLVERHRSCTSTGILALTIYSPKIKQDVSNFEGNLKRKRRGSYILEFEGDVRLQIVWNTFADCMQLRRAPGNAAAKNFFVV